MDLDKAADDDLMASMRMMEEKEQGGKCAVSSPEDAQQRDEETEKQWVHGRYLAYRVRRLFAALGNKPLNAFSIKRESTALPKPPKAPKVPKPKKEKTESTERTETEKGEETKSAISPVVATVCWQSSRQTRKSCARRERIANERSRRKRLRSVSNARRPSRWRHHRMFGYSIALARRRQERLVQRELHFTAWF